jgi:cyanophycin synthetase
VKQVVVEAVPRSGTAVLNADDPLVVKMAAASSGSVIYFSMNPDNETLRRQASRGRRSVTIESGRNGDLIVLRQGRKSLPLVWTHLIPATFEGRARMNVVNALAATAAAWAAGAHLHDIRQGLRTFATSYFQAPGRLNLFDLNGFRVLVDYAHNPHAMTALGSFIDAIAAEGSNGHAPLVTGKRIGVVATAGDRRDRDIRELGRVAASYFDRIVIREDKNPRGRPRGETAGLIQEGIEAAVAEGARCRKIETVLDELDATRHALDLGRRGDLVVLCVDHANLAWKELQHRLHGTGSDGEIATPATNGAGSSADIEAEDFY